ERVGVDDNIFAGRVEAAHVSAATPAMGSQLDQKDPPSPLPPLHVDSVRTLNLHEEDIGTIIWASGYRYRFDWVKLPILHANGAPVQQRGVTACPGVYFLGLHWMHTWRSAILAFVSRDAAYLADYIDGLGAGLGWQAYRWCPLLVASSELCQERPLALASSLASRLSRMIFLT